VGVDRLICVGTSLEDSKLAVQFANAHEGVFAAVGVHPHEVSNGPADLSSVLSASGKIVAIGEIGLDYHYQPYDREAQIELFEAQLQLARDYDLPVVFHVREAYADFWPVVDNFAGIRGVLHSFSDNLENLDNGLARDFFIGLNGIVTYKKTAEQAAAFAHVPLDKMLLETDAPYLTPSALRGTMNEPANVGLVFEWATKHCENKSPEEVAATTTKNAKELFNLNARERVAGESE
jgi:TatD DNase family protein